MTCDICVDAPEMTMHEDVPFDGTEYYWECPNRAEHPIEPVLTPCRACHGRGVFTVRDGIKCFTCKGTGSTETRERT